MGVRVRESRYFFLVVFALFLAASLLNAQVVVTGSLSGTVTDQTGAVIPGAQVKVVSEDTGTTYNLTTNEAGLYRQAALPAGFYRVEVTAPGFRRAVVRKIKVDVGTPAVTDVSLEVGATTESVEVQADATAVLTSTSAIGTTITGRQITELPFTSRDALDLAMLMPGFSSGGAPRAGSFNALPKGSINITMDGVNTMDNLLKSAYGGGFFTYVRPRIDAVDEFSISTAVAGAESAGEGAVQIKFITKRGTNDWHGGLFWYHRNTSLNANYYFNNLSGLPRQEMKLNQWGGKMGGPIIKNKLFIFGVFDEFRLPEGRLRSPVALKTEAVNGIFRYKGTDGTERTANLYQIAAANGLPSTPDPVVRDIYTKIDAVRASGQGSITPLDLFRDYINFNNTGKQLRRFPTGRLDWNVTDKIQWEAVWNYQRFASFPDFLNSYDRLYPGFEKLGNNSLEGGQYSNRFSVTTAMRYMINSRMNNEFRLGFVGGTVAFRPEVNVRMFPNDLRVNIPFISSPLNIGLPSNRNTPVRQLSDNLGWQKGAHTVNFGMSHSLITGWSKGYNVPTASLGITGTDPAAAAISATNIPFISTTDLANARSLYAGLTARISGISGSVYVDEKEKKYVPFAPLIYRERQTEFGVYVTDSWRMRPTLTLNYGLRWEFQGVPYDTNGIYTGPGWTGVWGLSGVGNLFAPGTLKGSPLMYNLRQGNAYNNDWNNFAPSLGFAWSPKSDHPVLRALFGNDGALRAGYGISYNREGLSHFRTWAVNAGMTATATLTADQDFPAGSLLLRGQIPALKRFPTEFSFPMPGAQFTYRGVAPSWFDPNLRVPYVQSWSLGIQREVLKDTVLEVRYVGNHGTKLWRAYNLNEINIFENGFLDEFKNAQKNLGINVANGVAGNFSNRGLPGQVNLPIFTAAFTGLAAASGFGSGTFVTNLQDGAAGSLANSLSGSATYFENMKKAGYPANFFIVNPEAAGSNSSVLANGASSTYNGLQAELRRRFSQGLQMAANYTWSHGLTDYYGDSDSSSSSYSTLRNGGLNKGASPYDIRHQWKINWIFELPFGNGKRWDAHNGFINRVIGGWESHGITRLQTGRSLKLTSGRYTVNQYDAGVIPKVSLDVLQSMTKIRKEPDKRIFLVDSALVGPDGRANPQYLDVPTTPGQWGYFLYMFGPPFVRFDLSAVKRTRITERWNVEIRAEFLNAFNNVNFLAGGPADAGTSYSIQATTFGRSTAGYNDVSTTNDPGGRIVQLVLRINF